MTAKYELQRNIWEARVTRYRQALQAGHFANLPALRAAACELRTVWVDGQPVYIALL